MESNDVRPAQLKSHKIVNDKFVERLELERRPTQRCAVQLLSLLVADRFFDDLDAKLRCFAIHPVLGIVEVRKEPIHSLAQLHARRFSTSPNAFGVLEDRRPVFSFNRIQCWQAPQLVRPAFPNAARLPSFFYNSRVSFQARASTPKRSCSDHPKAQAADF